MCVKHITDISALDTVLAVTVTISSDEEEAAPASDHGSTSSACPAFGASKLGVDSEDIFSTPLTRPSSNFGTSRRMKMEDAVSSTPCLS